MKIFAFGLTHVRRESQRVWKQVDMIVNNSWNCGVKYIRLFKAAHSFCCTHIYERMWQFINIQSFCGKCRKVILFTWDISLAAETSSVCHECVTRNHQPSFNPLFKHDKNSTHKLWGCVKYKIRNEITIQCVSQYFWQTVSEVRHEFQFHYAVVNQIAKFEPKL